MEDIQAIVIDNGSGYIKAGFGGDDAPRALFPAIACHYNGDPGSEDKESYPYVGDHATNKKGLVSYPIERGIVNNWDDMENIWQYTFYRQLVVNPKEQPVLLTEASLNPKPNREKMTQIMFEKFEVPALYVANQSVLAIYASGRGSGVIVQSGDGITEVVPVFEGFVLPHAIMRMEIGGSDLTDSLTKRLVERGYSLNTTAGDRELVRDIKEKMCYVADNFDVEVQNYAAAVTPDLGYELPHADPILLGDLRFQCPEVMFQPSLLGLETAGIHELVQSCIMKCDQSLQSNMYNNVILSGGNTLFRGLAERLQRELTVAHPEKRVKVVSPPERKYSTWIGGSILSSLSSFFIPMCISRQEYDEDGPGIVHKKCP